MNKVHEMFPLIVYQGSVDGHEEFKKKYLDSLKDYWFDGYENESPEYSGKIFLHLDSEYKDIFSSLKRNIDQYFEHLGIDFSKLNYHATKTWVGYHKNDETPSVRTHCHNEANISLIYYIKTDESSDKLCLSQINNDNEVVGGLFETSVKNNLIQGYNRYNCNFYPVTPIEGTAIIMPTKTLHSIQKETTRNDERVCIVSDVRVTLKEEYYNHHQGGTHPSQWAQL